MRVSKSPSTHSHAAAVLLLGMAAASSTFGQSTVSPAAKHAWSANAGWINFRPSASDGVVVGEHFLSGHAYAGNFAWLHFGDGSPTNGYHYANTDSIDFGVNHDGAGNLSGFAYGANLGWLSFGWATPSDASRPRIDLDTGSFRGFAYGANIGWINLQTGTLATSSLDCPDSDNDTIPDPWEYEHFEDLASANASSDSDGDGATDAQESIADTDPNDTSDYLRIEESAKCRAGSRLDPKVAMRLTFTSKPGRRYRIYYGTDLLRYTPDNTLRTIAPEAGDTTTVQSVVDDADALFFQVRAERPLK